MPLDNVSNIVLILSGKGGVGKSSVTLQLALSLTQQGKNVGILDIDLTGPSIPRLLGLEAEKVTQAPGGWLPVKVHDRVEGASNGTAPASGQNGANGTNGGSSNGDAHTTAGTSETASQHPTTTPPSQPQIRGSLHALSLAFLLPSRSSAVIWRGPKKTAMIRQFVSDVLWPPNTDYLLIDTPPGTSDEHIAIVEELHKLSAVGQPQNGAVITQGPRLAGAVVVTTPQAISTADVRKEINFCTKTQVPVIGVVENMSGYMCPCCDEVTHIFSKGGGEVMSREMGVRFLGGVPVDTGFGEMVEAERPRTRVCCWWKGMRRRG
ncbi:Cytosolic Fe-S cluster assembly factor CFD1 [Cyphellophora attinorum]|uniref:Cytosolic Fe-S cluster assembly factor CFD1 n=1 Tax=Cyphellophora attinorum TaxID=1664694 RepID=A0A0N1GXJ1_9EURO|nr:Cytosolic Fe-S cluster assembly factor CFD1 [Phialophora attinorum]KPI34970.1 Cytosolic Fe-S cluster assembly factor CFD1 [Phialophora attinorum]